MGTMRTRINIIKVQSYYNIAEQAGQSFQTDDKILQKLYGSKEEEK